MILIYVLLSLQISNIYAADLYSKFSQKEYTVKFTWLEVGHFDSDFFYYYNVVTFKYNRSATAANVTLKLKRRLDLTVTGAQVFGQVYKFTSNEYRIFPALRIQLQFCKSVEANLIGFGNAFNSCGNMNNTCIFEKEVDYHACNMYPDATKCPPLMPSGQYRLDIIVLSNDKSILLLHGFFKILRKLD